MIINYLLPIVLAKSVYCEYMSGPINEQTVLEKTELEKLWDFDKIQPNGRRSQQEQDIMNDLTLNITSIPSVKEGERILKDMCARNGANDSFDNVKTAANNVKKCFSKFIDFAQMPAKIMNAKPTGDLDLVFNDYCKESKSIEGCINQFLFKLEPCLPENQKTSKYTLQNITQAVLKFVCEKEGDYIALFISEKGPHCINMKQKGIDKCIQMVMSEHTNATSRINATVTERLNNTVDAFNNVTEGINSNGESDKLFSFLFGLEQCRSTFKLRKCITKELSACKGSTPANVVDSIFKLIQNSTSCSQFKPEEIDPSLNKAVPSTTYTNIKPIFISSVVMLLTQAMG